MDEPTNGCEPCNIAPPKKYSVWGITFMMLGAFSCSLMFLLVKLLADVNTFTLIFYRGLVQVVVSLMALQNCGTNPLGPPEVRLLLVGRAAFGSLAVVCWFFGAQVLPLSDAITLHFTSPPFAAAFAVCFLGEPWKPLDMVGAVVCLTGVALVAHPTFLFGSHVEEGKQDEDSDPVFQALAVMICTAGAAVAAMAYVCVRAIGDRASALVMVFYYGAVSLPVAVFGSVLFEGTWDVVRISGAGVGDVALVLLIGLLGVATQWFINLGLQLETAATASLATCTQIVWSYIFELAFLHEALDSWSLGGSVLILGYVLLVAYMKINKKEEVDSKDAPLLPDIESRQTVNANRSCDNSIN